MLTRIGAKLVSNEVQLGDKPQLDRLLGAIKVQLDAYLEGRIDALRGVDPLRQHDEAGADVPAPAALASGLDDPYQTGAENLSKTSEVKSDYSWDYIYEPDARSVIDDLLQRYVEGLLYQAVAENMASEQSARMVAMKAASDNAKKVIGDLQLVYNKTRQAAITKEISEIGAPPPSSAASRLKSYQARNRHEQRNHRSVHRRRGGYSVPRDHMPKIYEALTLADEGSSFAENLTFEVQQQLGDGVVRTIALGSSDGLRRGMKVAGTGAPISVPVGTGTLAASWTCWAVRSTKPVKSSTKKSAPFTRTLPVSTSCRRRSSCWKPASRLLTWCARSPRAARSACSAAPAWARPST